nr:hypothetical protein Iba_chr13cCG6880 [Ipomoea batatas]
MLFSSYIDNSMRTTYAHFHQKVFEEECDELHSSPLWNGEALQDFSIKILKVHSSSTLMHQIERCVKHQRNRQACN